MSKYLVIIESPGKIAKLKSFLGSEFDVVASIGHVVDLPKKKMGIDFKNNYEATWEVMPDKKDVLKSIITKAKKAHVVYLGTDLDREGEGISSNILKHLPADTNVKRIRYNSVTKDEVLRSMKEAGSIDTNMVEAYEARRILDRICGFKTSFLVNIATGGTSAGRVQSAALRILAEREREIINFVPQEYWQIGTLLHNAGKDKFKAYLHTPDKLSVKNEKDADTIVDYIKSHKIYVTDFQEKQIKKNTTPPFITSTLQAAASNILSWSQAKTNTVAQKLYEGSLITYMRTDSVYIIPEQIGLIRNEVKKIYGDAYLPAKALVYKVGKNAQEAHEAIRPTDISVRFAGSNDDERKLYTLIWSKTVASQMNPEIRNYRSADLVPEGSAYKLRAAGSKQLFNGWKAAYKSPIKDNDDADEFLPEFKVGEEVFLDSITCDQKFTSPLPRYGVATFNSKLEELGIARPSTLATVVSTLQARKYIELEGKSHKVTDLGLKVVDFLVKSNFCFIDIGFTKSMEDSLDEVLAGKKSKLDVLNEFWTRLKSDIKVAGVASAGEKTTFPCTACGGLLVKKTSRYGDYFACENRPTCKFTISCKDGKPAEKVAKTQVLTEHKCPCGGFLAERANRKTGDKFLSCEKFPKCKSGIFDINGQKIESKKTGSKKSGKKNWPKKFKKKED